MTRPNLRRDVGAAFLCFLTLEFLALLESTTAKGQLQCSCSTDECSLDGSSVCSASSMCYVQYLDRGDGASPWTRGCIDGVANSLLCENQPPAGLRVGGRGRGGRRKMKEKKKRRKSRWGSDAAADASDAPWHLWPLIHCCSSSFCNSEEFSSTLPKWMSDKRENATSPPLISPSTLPPLPPIEDVSPLSPLDHPLPPQPPRRTHLPLHVVYVVVPVVGVVVLVVIVGVAVRLLRQQRKEEEEEEEYDGTESGSTPSLSLPFLYHERKQQFHRQHHHLQHHLQHQHPYHQQLMVLDRDGRRRREISLTPATTKTMMMMMTSPPPQYSISDELSSLSSSSFVPRVEDRRGFEGDRRGLEKSTQIDEDSKFFEPNLTQTDPMLSQTDPMLSHTDPMLNQTDQTASDTEAKLDSRPVLFTSKPNGIQNEAPVL